MKAIVLMQTSKPRIQTGCAPWLLTASKPCLLLRGIRCVSCVPPWEHWGDDTWYHYFFLPPSLHYSQLLNRFSVVDDTLLGCRTAICYQHLREIWLPLIFVLFCKVFSKLRWQITNKRFSTQNSVIFFIKVLKPQIK